MGSPRLARLNLAEQHCPTRQTGRDDFQHATEQRDKAIRDALDQPVNGECVRSSSGRAPEGTRRWRVVARLSRSWRCRIAIRLLAARRLAQDRDVAVGEEGVSGGVGAECWPDETEAAEAFQLASVLEGVGEQVPFGVDGGGDVVVGEQRSEGPLDVVVEGRGHGPDRTSGR